MNAVEVIMLKSFVVFLLAHVCLTSGHLEEKIINGHIAGSANTRHQISLRLKVLDDFYFGLGHLCGGSLISSNGVLTAGHCVRDENNQTRNADELVVAMGTLVRNVKDNETLVFNVKSYVSHPKYDRPTISYDIAYILLDGRVPDNHPTIHPISLAGSEMPIDTVCEVTGWGYTEEGVPPDDLMAVDVRIIDINVCNAGYGGILTIIGKLCAGYMAGGRDACSGDSGGPLVCDGKLTGIVSFGDGCAAVNKPGIYTDVYYFRDWILQTTGVKESGSGNEPASGNSGNGSGAGNGIGSGSGLLLLTGILISLKCLVN